jgi:hypothetical protein
MKLHEVTIKLTKSQILKIYHDEPFLIKHQHVGHGRHVLHLKKPNINKLMNGHKIKLDSDEKERTIEGNGGINKFFKNVGNTLKKTFRPKNIEKALIHEGIPFASGAIGSTFLGPAGGLAGSIVGHEIADVVGNKTGLGIKIEKGTPHMINKMAKLRAMKKNNSEVENGTGFFKELHKIGISRKDFMKTAKHIGKHAANNAIDTISSAASVYTGVPIPESITNSIKSSADHLIDGKHREAITSLKSPVLDKIEEKIPILRNNLDHEISRLPHQVQPFVRQKIDQIGFGLKYKNHRVLKGGNVKISKMSKKIYKNQSIPIHAESEQTFSPYANANSPQMHPFIPKYNSFVHVVPLYGHGLYGNGLYGPSGHGLF